jgi:hypothetical protein
MQGICKMEVNQTFDRNAGQEQRFTGDQAEDPQRQKI